MLVRNRVACPGRSASPIPAVTGTGSRRTLGAAANIAELSLICDVLLGMLFVLWTAWWISILVVFAHPNTNSCHHSPFMTKVRLPTGLVDGQPVVRRPAVCALLRSAAA
jgi:hypothetical protein